MPLKAAAGDKGRAAEPKTRIVIYNLNVMEESKNYRYYSSIVPLSIRRNMQEYGSYEVNHVQEAQVFRKDLNNPEEKMKYLSILQSLSSDTNPDFIITGACEIKDNSLIIDLQVYDVKNRSLDYINKKSMESGVILKDTIDTLALKINESVISSVARNRVRFAQSPYLSFYRGISFITFGMDGGEAMFTGDWSDRFNDTTFVNSYIQFNLFRYFGISAGAGYMATDNRDMSSAGYFEFKIWEYYLDLRFPIRISKYFGVALNLGGGTAISRIDEYGITTGGSGPSSPINTERSKDAQLRGGISFFFDAGKLHVRFGSSFKRISYKDRVLDGDFGSVFNNSDPLDMYTVFAGIGYNI